MALDIGSDPAQDIDDENSNILGFFLFGFPQLHIVDVDLAMETPQDHIWVVAESDIVWL